MASYRLDDKWPERTPSKESRTKRLSSKGILGPKRTLNDEIPNASPLSRFSANSLGDDMRFEARKVEVPSDDDEDEAYISIGLDLGTTYSGLAWALSTSPKDINIIKNWESDLPLSFEQHKVPSVVTYNSKGEVCSWGYKLDEYRYHISWFKLCLSDSGVADLAKDQPEKYAEMQKYLTAFKKKPIDVVSDYLRCLWKHATENIKVNIGKHLWENLKIKIVVTVPAIWDHKTQESTRKAAEMAGLMARSSTTLELIGEPEAAALAVFDEMSVQKKRSLSVGDSFVVCDAGGGTVDLISYTIEQSEPLKLAMSTQSTGGLCGAIYLDGAFEKQIRTMISCEDYESLGIRSKRKMMHNWEYGPKRGYRVDSAENKKWYVDIPGYAGMQVPDGQSSHSLEGYGSTDSLRSPYSPPPYPDFPSPHNSLRPLSQLRISSPDPLGNRGSGRSDPGTLVLRTGHLDAIFSEVCSKTKDLVGDQLAVVTHRKGKEPKAILLVGGFGENIYLRQELERSFSHIEVQQPTKAWAAICRGAVLKGLDRELVVNHISKYNYGVLYDPTFDPSKHIEADKKMSETRQILVAKDQMKWFLHRGENVEKERPVKHDFMFPIASVLQLKTPMVFEILFSESSTAEIRKEAGVRKLCKLNMTVDPSKFDELPKHKNKMGVEWRQLDCSLELQVSSGQICWTGKYRGVEAGTIKTTVGYEGMAGN